MAKVFLTFFICLLILANKVNSQPVQEAHYKYGDRGFDITVNNALSTARKKVNIDVCLISATFARFTILPNGDISQIQFYENSDTPPVFRRLLMKAIESTKGNWIPKKVNGKPVESTPFILPLIYEIEAGCFTSGKHVDNGTTNALRTLFDNNNQKINCIMLKPLNIFSQN